MMRLRMLLVASSALAGLTLAGSAHAQTRAFAEDWETDASRWRAADASPITLARDAAGGVCSSQYLRDTVLFGGGRVFTRAGIPVTGGGRYCLAAWIRGSAGTQPFLGINLSDAAGAVGVEHWLVGRAPYANGYGGMATDAPSDGAWHWLTAAFTVEASATHVVIKSELFSAGAAGAADFDDVQLWAGGCPATPQGGAHVACSGAAAVCTPAGLCVQCAASSDCRGATPVCDTARSACVGCVTDANCSGPTPFCDATLRACVACRTGADCGGTTPVCDATRRVCAGCGADADCSGATPACLTSGACGECSMSNTTRCAGDRGACDVAAGRCAQCTATDVRACAATGAGAACVAGACGCAADSDCGDGRSGRVCDAMTRRCAAGCSPAMGRNGCPDGQFCTSSDASGAAVGRCTMTCNFDGDCARGMPTRPLCLAGDADMNRCVVCRADADCATRADGRALCDPSTSDCVECTAATRDRCSATGRGAACLSSGTCGCASDSDCGDARSGRVCDAMTSACAPGCRDGGNGCPDGMRCVTAVPGAAGVCEPTPPDAGADVPGDIAADAAVDVSDDLADVTDLGADVADDAPTSDVAADASAQDVAAQDVAAQDIPAQDIPAQDVALDAALDAGGSLGYSGDGCGCRTPGRAPTRTGAALLGVALAVAMMRRRRASATPPR